MTRQFRKRFRVRRRALEIWLEFLANNHPGYREFRLNRTTLNQLPEDGDVFEQLTIHTVDDLDGIPADAGFVSIQFKSSAWLFHFKFLLFDDDSGDTIHTHHRHNKKTSPNTPGDMIATF
jgi:hypothetical protein